jgi:hypothetical protein
MSEEIPEHIKKFKERYKNIQMMLDETSSKHHEASAYALNKLREEGKSSLDLDDADEAKKFAKHLSDFYIKQIDNKFKNTEINEVEKDLLLEQYAGASTSKLEQFALQYGKKLPKILPQIHGEHVEELGKKLYANMHNTVQKDHIEDIAKFTKLKYIDHNYLEKEQAGQILQEYFEKDGHVDEHKFRHKPFYKKKKEYK